MTATPRSDGSIDGAATTAYPDSRYEPRSCAVPRFCRVSVSTRTSASSDGRNSRSPPARAADGPEMFSVTNRTGHLGYTSYDNHMIAPGSDGRATRAISRRERAVLCPYIQTNVRWPLPVDQRLNELVSLLDNAGVQVTRSQLVAALVAQAPNAVAELQELFARYNQQSAGSVVLQTRGAIIPAE